MKKDEFLEAINAYLDGTANPYQKLLLEDYFDSFTFDINILDLLRDREVDEIKERIHTEIMKKIAEMEDW